MNIISVVGKIFDPLGFLSPVVIRFKIFFQELCEAKLGWDKPLTGPLLRKWISLGSSLQDSISISIPRCYYDGISNPVISCTLCGFRDASGRLMQVLCICFVLFFLFYVGSPIY